MRFFYLRDENGHPVGCIASDLVEDEGRSRVEFAVTACNPQDQFSRAHAQELTAGRLVLGDNPFLFTSAIHKGQVKNAILKLIVATPSYPQRVREAAKLFLSCSKCHGRKTQWSTAMKAHVECSCQVVVGKKFTIEDFKAGRPGKPITMKDLEERMLPHKAKEPTSPPPPTPA